MTKDNRTAQLIILSITVLFIYYSTDLNTKLLTKADLVARKS